MEKGGEIVMYKGREFKPHHDFPSIPEESSLLPSSILLIVTILLFIMMVILVK
jgi:hypothetical protein